MDAPEIKQRVSVVSPIASAWDRMVRVCFRPFDFNKWVCLGLAVFLAGLWSSFMQYAQHGFQIVPIERIVPPMTTGQDLAAYLQQHGPTMLLAGGVVFILLYGLYGLMTFFACRGKFMYLDGLMHNYAQIKAPWRAYAQQANALFVFKVSVTLVFWLTNFACLAVVGWVVWPDVVAGMPGDPSMWSLIVALPILTVLWLLYLKGMVVTTDFVVPMMIAQPIGPWRAWAVWLGQFLKRYMWAIILFYLMRMIFVSVIGTLSIFACCFTCGLGALPVIQSVVLLPALTFDRLYSAYFVEQFGTQWLVFPRDQEEALACPGCRYDLRGNPAAESCPECGYDLTMVPKIGENRPSMG